MSEREGSRHLPPAIVACAKSRRVIAPDHLLQSLRNVLASRSPRCKDQRRQKTCPEVSVKVTAQSLRARFELALRRAFHFYWWLARGMTLGVRAVVLDHKDRVFLVKHSYIGGWHLPGGGVEVGETFREALARELVEEGRIELLGEPALHGLFLNSHVSRRDHVAVYLVRHFRQDRLPEPNREIVECGFFEAGALPAQTTAGTRLRITEVIEGREPAATWR
jgi:ADP-ribose pyrophosphatase YjhB (NUDIX family)